MLELIGAIIGGVAVVVAAVIGRSGGRKAERKVMETRSQESVIALQAQLATRFGVRAASLSSHMVVLNEKGDALVRRWWRGIRAAEGHTVSHLAGAFHTVTPGAAISKPVSMRLPKAFSKPVSLEILGSSETHAQYRVCIEGSLTSSDPPLDYDVEAEYSATVLMSAEAIRRAYANDIFKDDYFYFDVDWPLERLELQVVFTRSSDITYFPVVFMGATEFKHEGELERCRTGFTLLPHGASFVVAGPLVGFRYAIFWKLPSSPLLLQPGTKQY